MRTDEGITGYGSGDTMAGFEAYTGLFTGTDPLQIAAHVRRLETIGFHAGRYWPLEAALWDVIGKVCGQPVAVLFGGATDRLPAYASFGEHKSPAGARRRGAGRPRRGISRRQDPDRARRTSAAGWPRSGPRGRRRRRLPDHGGPEPVVADAR